MALVAGLSKLTHLLPPDELTVSPLLTRLSPLADGGLLSLLGVVQLAIGVSLVMRPRIGASAVVAWLSLSTVNWMLLGSWQQVLSTATLLAAACAFVQLARAREAGQTAARRAKEPRVRARLPRTDTLASVTDD